MEKEYEKHPSTLARPFAWLIPFYDEFDINLVYFIGPVIYIAVFYKFLYYIYSMLL